MSFPTSPFFTVRFKKGLLNKPAPKNQEKLKENVETHMQMLAQNPQIVHK